MSWHRGSGTAVCLTSTGHETECPAMNVQPGDILVTRSASLFGRLIRLGAALRDQPNADNHVAIVHHTDKHGTTWCLEGRPGGVGWRDARDYLRSPWTMTNVGERK